MFLVVLLVGVYFPDVVVCAKDVLGGEESGEDGMVHVVIFEHAVSADGLQVPEGRQVFADDAEALRVRGVVDGIRLRDACHEPVDELGRLAESDRLKFAHGERKEVLVVHGPEVVAFGAEVFEPESGLGRVGDHVGAPGLEVLYAPESDFRGMHVDPGVRERTLGIEDDARGDEAAVCEAAGGFEDMFRSRRGERRYEFGDRHGRDEPVGGDFPFGAVPVADDDASHGSVLVMDLHDGGFREDRSAGLADVIRHAFVHHARSEFRIPELVDERLDLSGLVRKESRPDGARERQSFDALRRPFGLDLGAGDAPEFFGI